MGFVIFIALIVVIAVVVTIHSKIQHAKDLGAKNNHSLWPYTKNNEDINFESITWNDLDMDSV